MSYSLDPLLSSAYSSLVGKSPNAFQFTEGVTPLSTWPEALAAVATYLAVIFGGQAIMRSYAPVNLPLLSKIHNASLTVGSFVLLVWMLDQVSPILYNHGLWYAICNPKAYTQRLELLYYINYLFKYYELIDTLFLMLKKKKLEFLHYYHHSMTLMLCFVQLHGQTSLSWLPIVLNLMVHVVMYYYYLLTCFGIRVWWKKHLTTLQIVQFVLDLIFVYAGAYSYFAYTYFSFLPNYGSCAGSETAALFGVGSLTSYLVLFVQFFIATYNRPKPATANGEAKAKGGGANGVAQMNGGGANGVRHE